MLLCLPMSAARRAELKPEKAPAPHFAVHLLHKLAPFNKEHADF